MSSKKMFFVMAGLLGLLSLVLVATVVLGDIFLHKQSNKLVNLKLDSQVIESQQTSLTQAKKDLQKYSELAKITKQIVPQDKEQTQATREILSLAAQAGVSISGISFPASTLGQPTAKSTTTPSTTTPAVPTTTQLKPVQGVKNLYQLDIIVTSDTANPTTYPKLINFLSRLENNRRTSQVTQIIIQPDSQNRLSLNFTLTVTIYVKP